MKTKTKLTGPKQMRNGKHPAHKAGVTVVIPMLNESCTIGKVVRFALRDPRVAEVLVVDDGSIDGTPERAAQLFEDGGAMFRLRNPKISSGNVGVLDNQNESELPHALRFAPRHMLRMAIHETGRHVVKGVERLSRPCWSTSVAIGLEVEGVHADLRQLRA